MNTLIPKGPIYCFQGTKIGKFQEIVTNYLRGNKIVNYGKFLLPDGTDRLIHQANLEEVKVCPSGGKSRRRRNRKQRKTRRH